MNAFHVFTHWKNHDYGCYFNRPLFSDGFSFASKASGRDYIQSFTFKCDDFGHFAYEYHSKTNKEEKLNATVDD